MRIHASLSTLAVATALCWGAGHGLCRSRVTETSMPAIQLRVVNEAGVDPETLSLAEKEATDELRHSGIRLVWLACEAGRAEWGSGNPCQRERGPSEFWLRIVTRRPACSSGDVLGFSELDESVGRSSAGVYYPKAEEMADYWSVRVGQILGAAIAHEVGHLLLGANAHSRSGVMSAHWSHEQFQLLSIGELHFSPDQSKELRERIENGR